MDPTATLQDILAMLADFDASADPDECTYARADIAERLRNLADWIEKGGCMPAPVTGEGRPCAPIPCP